MMDKRTGHTHTTGEEQFKLLSQVELDLLT